MNISTRLHSFYFYTLEHYENGNKCMQKHSISTAKLVSILKHSQKEN